MSIEAAMAALAVDECRVLIARDETVAKLPNYYDKLETVTHLLIEMPITPDHFIPMVMLTKAVQVIEVSLLMSTDLPLDIFTTCSKLHTLVLRGDGDHAPGKVVAFSRNKSVSLRSFTLNDLQIAGDFIRAPSSFAQLERLCLARSHLNTHTNVSDWKSHLSLVSLNLKGTLSGEVHTWGIMRFKNLVTSLKREMPACAIEVRAQGPVVDKTDYKGVLVTERSRHCYSAADLLANRWTETELDRLLVREGEDEAENWQVKSSNVLTHNTCELPGASPFRSPDGRVRIATVEPEPSELQAFWKYIEDHDVSVIAMVKEIGWRGGYFPAKGESAKYGDITVTCTSCEVDAVSNSSRRKFQVGKKTVHHIQIDWEDGHGIEHERLMPFIKRLNELEQANRGKTVIHCMGGYGRTGTLLACMILEQLIDKAKNRESLYINLEELVRALRQQRYGMIAFGDQLITVLEYARFCFTKAS
ncbi:MAG: hypothetical protein JSR37_01605 [Verrucomicrobia bacterium]|nr:hypothetical protein [Verrucomicrobiota bacterium]MBS0638101.1 hypothetical protein [Verrucomicrobiota bacterium]